MWYFCAVIRIDKPSIVRYFSQMGHTSSQPRTFISLYWLAAIVAVIAFLIFAASFQNGSRSKALATLQTDTTSVAQGQAWALEGELQKFRLLPLVLSENHYVTQALKVRDHDSALRLNERLELLATRTRAPYIYVVDVNGETVASSNYRSEESFVGRRYEFRPYFQQAMTNGASEYFAKGERTGKSGLFFARRIQEGIQTLGVIVVKVEFASIVSQWKDQNAITFVTSDDGIVLFSSDPVLDFTTLTPLTKSRQDEILTTRQFGDAPLKPTPLAIGADYRGKDANGQHIQAAAVQLSDFDWRIIRAELIRPAIRAADTRARLTILSVGFLLGAIATFLSWRFTRERERAATTAFLKAEVARQTAELSQTNERLEYEFHEREKIIKRFRTAREELAQANRLGSIGAITASVAHEINQPVAAIRAFAENAAKFMARDQHDKVAENIHSIVELTARIGSITQELRRYARRGTQAIGKVKLSEVIDGAELLIGERIRSEGINFDIQVDHENLPCVKAGRVRLEQVLVNLLQNALDAVSGRPDPCITLSAKEDEEFVYVTIEDNGNGVDDAQAKEIFTPFVTTKPQGLGMGLGIASDIMTEFGGSIELSPSALGGAAFELKLVKM